MPSMTTSVSITYINDLEALMQKNDHITSICGCT